MADSAAGANNSSLLITIPKQNPAGLQSSRTVSVGPIRSPQGAARTKPGRGDDKKRQKTASAGKQDVIEIDDEEEEDEYEDDAEESEESEDDSPSSSKRKARGKASTSKRVPSRASRCVYRSAAQWKCSLTFHFIIAGKWPTRSIRTWKAPSAVDLVRLQPLQPRVRGRRHGAAQAEREACSKQYFSVRVLVCWRDAI